MQIETKTKRKHLKSYTTGRAKYVKPFQDAPSAEQELDSLLAKVGCDVDQHLVKRLRARIREKR